MTKETDIDISKEKEFLIKELKSLCQYHYLPFSTQNFNSAFAIIDDFLRTLLSGPKGQSECKPLFDTPAIKAIVPGFHLLYDFENWKSKPIDTYEVLSKIEPNLLNEIFNIHEYWITQKEGKNTGTESRSKPIRFSDKIIETLNSKDDEKEIEKNGRIKIIIRSGNPNENKIFEHGVAVNYSEEEKIIQFIIPPEQFETFGERLPKVEFNEKGSLYSLAVGLENKFADYPNFPSLKLSNVKSTESKKKYFTRLALDLYKPALEHFLYLNSQTSLLYIFSNNTEYGEKDVGLGGMFILLEKGIADDLKKPDCKKIINYFSRLTDALSSRLINFYQVQQVERQAIRAAISQVMARNMSHNIGSHVLSRMTDPEAISKLIDSKNSEESNQYQSIGLHANDEDSNSASKLIATFNSYMKSRMDFLADITTGVPTIENSKWFFKEILSGFDKNRVLLDRISGIDTFYYKIISRNHTGEDKFGDTTIRENAISEGNYEIINDLVVSIPNDILGCHSIYIILENLIRNCAKHGDNDCNGKSKDKSLIIYIDIKERQEDTCNELYEVTIYDNNEVTGEEIIEDKIEQGKYAKYFDVPSETNFSINRLQKLVFDQNNKLNLSMLNNGTLRQGAWGLIEMDASSAYLRKIPVEQIDHDKYNINIKINNKDSLYPENLTTSNEINILKAVEVDNKHLGYRFFLFKPREVLIIDELNNFSQINEESRKELLKQGILLCNSASNTDTFKYNAASVYNHKLVVIIAENTENIVTTNNAGLSERILKIESTSISQYPDLILLSTDITTFKKQIWKYYIKQAKYKFFKAYSGLLDNGILSEITNPESNEYANYYDHGKDYARSTPTYKEITYSAIMNFMPEQNDVIKTIQFIDSIHSKILILDERIQEYNITGKYKPQGKPEISICDIYRSTNLFIPQKGDGDLGVQNFDKEYDKIMSFIKENKDCCFIIIHLGVIEKLIASYNRINNVKRYDKETDVELFLRERICTTPFIAYSKIVIISGRGTPHNLPKNIRYLNYSIISQYMIDIRFKYLLSEAVFSARKIN